MGNEPLRIKIMRAAALTCMEFKGHLIIKVDACEEVLQAQAGFDIFISRMRAAREEARKVNTDVGLVCSGRNLQPRECRYYGIHANARFARGSSGIF